MITPPRAALAATAAAAAALLAAACSDSNDCARGNPLMPACLARTAGPLERDPLIVFESTINGNLEIYSSNADGTDLVRLTNDAGADISPRWSPDRSQIAFTSARGGGFDVWLMSADGSNPRKLTTVGTADDPDWSPDGARLVFDADRGDGNFDIYTINADGTGLKRLTSANSQVMPRWSPDGRRIAMTWFESTAGCAFSFPASTCNGRTAVMNVDGTGLRVLRQVGGDDLWPDWSPDGRQLVFSSYRSVAAGVPARQQIMLMNDDGSHARPLTTGMLDEWNPVWSRTSNRIFFVRNYQVYSARVDGTDPGRVTAHGGMDRTVHVR